MTPRLSGKDPAVLRTYLLFAGVLALTVLVYAPGLSGGFLFDDFTNLELLGYYGVIDHWEAFWLYLLSGFSGPTGRPLSHLSFLIDANHWPADPWPFKRTNLVIHLLTGVTLMGLMRALAIALGKAPRRALQIAILGTALWLLNPFWVSTTLYVIQRMAQLSTLFVLAGLWLYVSTRLRYPPILNIGNILGLGTAIALMGLLAVLSKENGVLLPLLALLMEATVLAVHDRRANRTPTRPFTIYRLILLAIPILLLTAYLARGLPALFTGEPGQREFTPGERLLTQGRLLWDYVFHILLPRPYTGGLFNDHIRLSTGLFSPWNTALAWAAWIVIAVWAWRNRLRHAAWSLAILFFLAGHVLESSFLQLELYFEHRNYLPAALFGLPVAIWLAKSNWPHIAFKRLIAIGVIALLAGTTFLRADLWGNPFQQALKWAQINQDSPRAQDYLGSYWLRTGNLAEAERLNTRAIALDHNGLPWLMRRVVLDCTQERDAHESLQAAINALERPRQLTSVHTHHAAELFDYLISGACGTAGEPRKILRLIDRLLEEDLKRKHPGLQVLLLQRRAQVLLQMQDSKAAFDSLLKSVQLSSDPGIQFRGAAVLASHGVYDLALQLLDYRLVATPPNRGISIDRVRKLYTDRLGYYEREKQDLRERIEEDARTLTKE